MNKKVGRPTKNNRPVLAMRIAEPLLLKLKKSAATSGLSISQEAEARLEKSFSKEELDPAVELAIQRAVARGMNQ